MRTEVPLFRFKPFTILRYSECWVDKTTFIIGERREDDDKCLIKIMKYRDDTHVIPIEKRCWTIHRVKMMELICESDPTDVMIMEYIDTYEKYLIGAEQHRNALWTEADEKYYNSMYDDDLKPAIGTHTSVFPVE
tara:strand:+ start:757 stop:1161 length:405 start_codon:yes stop_codon:yes gene_type:complete